MSGFNSSNNSPPGTKVAPTTIFLSSLALEHPTTAKVNTRHNNKHNNFLNFI